MAGRAAAQKSEQEEQAELKKRKVQPLLDLRFLRIPEVAAVPLVLEAELQKYEKLAFSRKGQTWVGFLKKVLETPLPEPQERTLDSLVKTAMSAQRPMPVERKESDVSRLIKEMVATKVPGQPKVKPSCAIAAVELAADMQQRKLNFVQWCGQERVA
jgi:hypothetical protein